MLTLPGTSALSPFRLENLLAQLKSIKADISAISASYQHFVQLNGELAPQQTQMLQRLLDYGYTELSAGKPDEPYWLGSYPADAVISTLWVVPRTGTISPWSSKASEIAERCDRIPRDAAHERRRQRDARGRRAEVVDNQRDHLREIRHRGFAGVALPVGVGGEADGRVER